MLIDTCKTKSMQRYESRAQMVDYSKA